MSNSGKRNEPGLQNRKEDRLRHSDVTKSNTPTPPLQQGTPGGRPSQGRGEPFSTFAAIADENPGWARRLEANLRAIPRLLEASLFAIFVGLGAVALLTGFVRVEFPATAQRAARASCQGASSLATNQTWSQQIITGEVITKARRPVRGVLIDLYYPGSGLRIQVTSDDNGKIAFPSMPGDIYIVPHVPFGHPHESSSQRCHSVRFDSSAGRTSRADRTCS